MAGVDVRWIRLGLVEPLALHATCAGLATSQAVSDQPIVLWAQAKSQLCLGPGFAAPDANASVRMARRPPGADLEWVDANQYVFVLIAPRRFAPGRPARWAAWALGPVIATYRAFGLPAYVSGQEIWLHGRRIAGSRAAAMGACAVIASSFLPRFSLERSAEDAARPSADFKLWLREGLSLATTEWAGQGEAPSSRDLEETFRERIAAHYGWRFENGWPGAAEQSAIGVARSELASAGSLAQGPARGGQLAW